jgi:hypothetical protein
MVARIGNQPGKAHLGCLFSLFLLACAIWVGVDVGEVYVRHYRLQDFVKSQAEFAPELTDDVIRQRLVAYSDTLGPSIGPKRWNIKRSNAPRAISIRAQYDDSVVIQVLSVRKVLRFHFDVAGKADL